MDIADRIARKEWAIIQTRDLIDMLRDVGLEEKDLQTWYEKIEQLEKSVKEDREVQKLEAKTSGRKTSIHYPHLRQIA